MLFYTPIAIKNSAHTFHTKKKMLGGEVVVVRGKDDKGENSKKLLGVRDTFTTLIVVVGFTGQTFIKFIKLCFKCVVYVNLHIHTVKKNLLQRN